MVSAGCKHAPSCLPTCKHISPYVITARSHILWVRVLTACDSRQRSVALWDVALPRRLKGLRWLFFPLYWVAASSAAFISFSTYGVPFIIHVPPTPPTPQPDLPWAAFCRGTSRPLLSFRFNQCLKRSGQAGDCESLGDMVAVSDGEPLGRPGVDGSVCFHQPCAHTACRRVCMYMYVNMEMEYVYLSLGVPAHTWQVPSVHVETAWSAEAACEPNAA